MTNPMTREESIRILGIESTINDIKDDIDPKVVMDRFEELFSKNDPEKGGSFYIQSKIYFAKEFLMQDHPAELNISKFNPAEGADESDEEKKSEESSGKEGEETQEKKQ